MKKKKLSQRLCVKSLGKRRVAFAWAPLVSSQAGVYQQSALMTAAVGHRASSVFCGVSFGKVSPENPQGCWSQGGLKDEIRWNGKWRREEMNIYRWFSIYCCIFASLFGWSFWHTELLTTVVVSPRHHIRLVGIYT